MKIINTVKNPYVSLSFHFLYALANCAVGLVEHSWWFITVGIYYAVLATTRFCVLYIKSKTRKDNDSELFAQRTTGILLVVLSFCIIGVNILSAIKDRGSNFHEIVMITIATYTFTKITVAILGMISTRHSASPASKALRNISLADASVSLFTMQRSMLVSFPGMDASEIQLLNILTGTAVWILVLFLGINLIGGKFIHMSKSKIADTVTSGYKKIETSVVNGYKKIETGVVNSYLKIEDRFVEAYLTKDGESVEEAKERLKKGK